MSYAGISWKKVSSLQAIEDLIDEYLVKGGWEKVSDYTDTFTILPTAINTSTATITYPNHGFQNNDLITYKGSTGSAITGVLIGVPYRVVVVNENSFKLMRLNYTTTQSISNAGSGTHTFKRGAKIYRAGFDNSTRPVIYLYTGTGASSSNGYIRFGFYRIGYPNPYPVTELHFYTGIYNSTQLQNLSNYEKIIFYCSPYYIFFYSVYLAPTPSPAKLFCGHFLNKHYKELTYLTQNVSSGSNVTLYVENSTEFKVNRQYTIVSKNYASPSETVTVIDIPSSTTLVVESLSNSYSAGDLIGLEPIEFLDVSFSNATAVSKIDGSTVDAIYPLYTSNTVNEGSFKRLFPVYFVGNYVRGHSDDNFFYVDPNSIDDYGLCVVDLIDSATTSGNNDTNTLNVGSSRWVSNSLTGKYVAITSGNGDGQIRKIVSNTDTQLVVTPDWDTTPDTDSSFLICKEVYRRVNIYCLKEQL